MWTTEIPPLGGYFWWRWNEHAVPTVAYLWYAEGTWVWDAHALEDVQVEGAEGENGWWWPVPLMMPPLSHATRHATGVGHAGI